MSRSHLRGLGLVTSVILAASLTLGTPANAEGTTGTIAGTITAGGAPVASASVQVESTDGSFFGYGYTDPTGQYLVTGVPEGASAYRVHIYPSGRPAQYAHGALSEETATLFSVVGDQTTTVDEELLPTATISGHLRDAHGNPAAGAWVSADEVGSGTAAGSGTDADGAFTLGVFAGTYRISFYANGQSQYAFGTRDYSSATLFTVAIGDSITVDDTLLATGSIAGRLTYSDGSPASDVSVQVENDSGSAGYGYTGPDGTYQVDGVVPGNGYNVRFQLPSGASEYAHHAFTREDATDYTVVADQVTTVDEQLPPTGTIAGRFTDLAGNGLGGVEVSGSGVFPTTDYVYTTTDSDGTYRLAQIFPGNYQVTFSSYDNHVQQYAFSKLRFQDADVISVTAGQTTTVDDRKLPSGSLKVTAKDALTGAPVQSFWVDLGTRGDSTTTGELLFDDVSVGDYKLSVGADGYAYMQNAVPVTITAGNQSVVEVALRPVGKITTKVVDGKTGRPVAGICVLAQAKDHFNFPDGCPSETDENGNITVNVDTAGTYNLFALPPRGSVYGAQWVGSKGGTGTQGSAAKLTVASGQTTVAPKIKLDKHGTITGKVTSATGQPLSYGVVGVVGPDTGAGADKRYVSVAPDGTYTVDFLGPYKWPLLFGARDHAYQWSGAVGDRFSAALVSVKAGKTTKFNYTLKVGTDLTINYTGPSNGGNRFVLFNATANDVMGVVDGLSSPMSVHVPMIGPQTVKVLCYCGSVPGGIWLGGTDFAGATPVAIPAGGSKVITFDVP